MPIAVGVHEPERRPKSSTLIDLAVAVLVDSVAALACTGIDPREQIVTVPRISDEALWRYATLSADTGSTLPVASDIKNTSGMIRLEASRESAPIVSPSQSRSMESHNSVAPG